jgi:hypothetical protein
MELVPDMYVVEMEPTSYPRAPIGKKRIWFDARTLYPMTIGDVGDQTKASGSNPSASITVTRCPSQTASMALTMPTAPNPMTVTCWRASLS